MAYGSYLVFLFIVSQSLVTQAFNVSWELQLKAHLLDPEKYDATSRPRLNTSQHVLVTFSWTIINLLHIDDLGGSMTQVASINLTWTDDFLTWNPDDFGGIEEFVIAGKRIWTPELRIGNRVGGDLLKNYLLGELVRVRHTGSIVTSPIGHLTTSCDVDPGLFPFDCQSCDVVFGTWMYKESEIKILSNHVPLGRSTYQDMNDNNPFWKLVNINVKMYPYNGVVPEYRIAFNMERKSKFFSFMFIGPACILSILTLASFLIPADEGERVSYGISLFLAEVVFLLDTGNNLPPVSKDNYPIMGVYLMLLLVSSMLATLTSILLVFIHGLKQTSIPPAEAEGCFKESELQDSEIHQPKSKSTSITTNVLNTKRINISVFIICLLNTLAANLVIIYPNVIPCE